MADPAAPPPALPEPRHRAPSTNRRRTILAVVAALVLAAVGTGFVWMRSGHDPSPVAAPPTTSSYVPPPPSPTPTPTPTPTKPSKPPIPHEVVKASGPTTFLFQANSSSLRFSIKAHVCAMADIRPLDPPGEQHHTVCWVETKDGFGGNAPSSNSATTYVLGHSWAEDSLEVLNKISEPATKEILAVKPKYVDGVPIYPVQGLNGSMVTLWTPTAKLKYKVTTVYGVDKNQAGNVHSLMDSAVKHRIVIITCAERNGIDYHYNVILYAYLYSSQKRSPSV